MNLVCAIDRRAAGGDVGGGLEIQDFAIRQFGVERVPVVRDAAHRLTVDLDAGQDLFVTIAATRVRVCLIDKLLDGAFAVPDDMCRDALGDGDKAIVYNQSAEVGAL